MNAAKPSFPTSIVGIVFTCFGWVGQGSPMKEGFKAYKFYKFYNGAWDTRAARAKQTKRNMVELLILDSDLAINYSNVDLGCL